MKLNYFIFFLLCLCSIRETYAQKFSNSDSTSRARARKVASFSSTDNEMSLIIFSPVSDTKYLMLEENQYGFIKTYIKYGINDSIPRIIKKQEILFEKYPDYISFFDKTLYCDGFIKLDSDFYKNYEDGKIKYVGEAAYFGYYKGNDNVCETILPIVISPMPINEEVYRYLIASFASHEW